jgi:hypothetical protein
METLPTQSVAHQNPPSFAENFSESINDLDLIGAARELYQKYLQIHEHRAQEPIGVVLNPISYRGKLLFRQAPVLLPEERFIPLQKMCNGGTR